MLLESVSALAQWADLHRTQIQTARARFDAKQVPPKRPRTAVAV